MPQPGNGGGGCATPRSHSSQPVEDFGEGSCSRRERGTGGAGRKNFEP